MGNAALCINSRIFQRSSYLRRAQALDKGLFIYAASIIEEIHCALGGIRQLGIQCGHDSGGNDLQGLLVARNENVHGEPA